MKAQEARVLDDEQLAERLEQAHRQLFDLRFKLAVGQVENNQQIRHAKRDIARLQTILRERQLAIRTGLAETTVGDPAE